MIIILTHSPLVNNRMEDLEKMNLIIYTIFQKIARANKKV
jgi:hypothetical protein